MVSNRPPTCPPAVLVRIAAAYVAAASMGCFAEAPAVDNVSANQGDTTSSIQQSEGSSDTQSSSTSAASTGETGPSDTGPAEGDAAESGATSTGPGQTTGADTSSSTDADSGTTTDATGSETDDDGTTEDTTGSETGESTTDEGTSGSTDDDDTGESSTGDLGEWTCPLAFFHANDGCDCGCGIIDPDCADATVESCDYCSETGSCNDAGCPGTISPTDNSVCESRPENAT